MNGATKISQNQFTSSTKSEKAAGPLGFEPRLTDPESARIRVFPEENGTFPSGAAPGAAVGPENAPIDPDLRAIIERWAELPDAVKAGIVAMVNAAGG